MKQLWTVSEIEVLKKLYPDASPSKLVKTLKRSITKIYSKANLLGLKRTVNTGCIKKGSTIGCNTQFKPGISPFNKGKKQVEYMSKSGIKASSNTRFKSGRKPHNTKTDNYISIRTDTKTGIKEKYIRLSESIWLPYRQFVWIQNYGEIPKDKIVIFKSSNRLDWNINDLILVSRVQNLERNRLSNYPKEFQDLIKLNNNLKRLIHAQH